MAILYPRFVDAAHIHAAPQTRCGWFGAPPGNYFRTDRDADWVIAAQNARPYRGKMPKFTDKNWVSYTISYGYGCLKVTIDTAIEPRILYVHCARPLSACRQDTALKGKEPVADKL